MTKKNIKLKNLVLKTLEDQKSLDITTIPLKDSSLADYIIIATTTSSRHAMSIKDKLIMASKANKFPIQGYEGDTTGENGGNWIIVDLSDIIVHLFRPEARELYNLEKIWF
jgi:ribosome-associated protein